MCGETRIPRDMCAGNTHPGETQIPVTPALILNHDYAKLLLKEVGLLEEQEGGATGKEGAKLLDHLQFIILYPLLFQ